MDAGNAKLLSRNGLSLNARFAPVVEGLRDLDVSSVDYSATTSVATSQVYSVLQLKKERDLYRLCSRGGLQP